MKFNVGNPEWRKEDGRVVTYRCDEEFGWRQTVYPDGAVEVHKAPLAAIDAVMGMWAPWNNEPLIDESLWEEVLIVVRKDSINGLSLEERR